LQQAVVHPTISEFALSALAAQTSLQDCSPLRHTRKDWLPIVQAFGVGFKDWSGGGS